MSGRKIIISCAITGSIHTPSMSPYLPVTPEEIAASALGATEAGAAIVHLHARDPQTGKPDQNPEAFEPLLRVIRQASDVVVNLTTGGSPYMPVEEGVRPAQIWRPEIASLNMGSMNFGLFPMLRRYSQFRHDWEEPMLRNSDDLVVRNSFRDIRYALETLNATGARYEFECYDTSNLYNLHHFWKEGLVQAPLFIQTCFGLLGCIGAHPDDVMHMKRTADRTPAPRGLWSRVRTSPMPACWLTSGTLPGPASIMPIFSICRPASSTRSRLATRWHRWLEQCSRTRSATADCRAKAS
jgi:uncharacterized protein (DUF849 family)